MLPYLKPKKLAQIIVANRKPNGEQEVEESEENSELIACAEEIISAINMKDASALASALSKLIKSE